MSESKTNKDTIQIEYSETFAEAGKTIKQAQLDLATSEEPEQIAKQDLKTGLRL